MMMVGRLREANRAPGVLLLRVEKEFQLALRSAGMPTRSSIAVGGASVGRVPRMNLPTRKVIVTLTKR